ncbi:uncharacterized protein CcaverHIS019_0103620 [Cutaneotrichosporon cavernicola]|uniref:Amino acid transporter transmembrane domain-containing protein n=1 Tax=Cutaneotrichosporon cavernicola TaxID=279322 RepID=A0AA48I159_9TREE|nr:uncharacterized protein CcaverHIS019_0103620 [Cutaneotrichosporon cavernicola]BEI87644.1 hypothetical protein CcaverHIS019_0103620 [Cutaneotrichosporon cavernicola]BEI95416.1 hypothetical protein CcaverHIS631_0103650 [Cutaneotrichosporon cavernicola]
MPAERSVPIGTPRERGGRRQSVVRSSLELVFSYSRSQQRFYAGLPSAPSFVDSHWGDVATDDDANEDREWDTEAGGSRSGYSSADDGEAIDTTSEASAFFPDDPVRAVESRRGSPTDLTSIRERRGEEEVARSITASLPTKRGGLLQMYGTTPSVPLSSSLTSSSGSGNSNGNSGGATPRAGTKPLPDDLPTRRVSVQRGVGVGHGPPTHYKQLPSETTPLLATPTKNWAPERLSPLNSPTRSRRSSAAGPRRVSHRVPAHVGESSDGQTLFNATAVLVGIGLLSMPLAFSYAGWIGGTLMLIGFSYITCTTAKMMARLIFVDHSLVGYTDIGRAAFGPAAGAAINVLFCLELFAIGVALMVLLGDSLNALFPSVSSDMWKVIGLFVILPTTFMPLWLLSFPSVISTFCTVLLIGIVVFDGLWKTKAPGSIMDPMPTHLGPQLEGANWLGGVGLVLAGFGGHAVIPSIARDMKHPESATRVFNIAFTVACIISFAAGATGYLMFGNEVSDQITRDLKNPAYGYPTVLNAFAVWMIISAPVSKFGLCSRPLNIAVEGFLGLAPNPAVHPPRDRRRSVVEQVSSSLGTGLAAAGASDYLADDLYDERPKTPVTPLTPLYDPNATRRGEGWKGIARIVSRTIITVGCTATAILLPGFEKVMAFLGNCSSFLICIILPMSFYLRLSPRMLHLDLNDPSVRFSRSIQIAVVIISTVFMCLGTAWAFMPGTGRGAE